MFKPTGTPYKFKYLITGITGEGIKEVYLPDKPSDEEIHFKAEQKFIRPELPKHIRKASRILYAKSDSRNPHYDPLYVSPYFREIKAWEDQQWERFDKGFWFWNDNELVYITPFYYFYLTEWVPYFGAPDFRMTDVEITYWLQYMEEDDCCYGGALNTIRRYGKSALMAAWAYWRTTQNFGHFTGMQGESDNKIEKFWSLHMIKPFRKLLGHVKPQYDTSSKQTVDLLFERPISRGEKGMVDPDLETDFDDPDSEDLESYMDYRESSEGAYDQAVLMTYLMEEPGKTKKCNVNDRWTTVKPCLRRGRFIRGKALLATTVEHMNVMDRGGKAYQKIFYESDFDKRDALNQTVSGLYAAFLPGDCAYEGFIDEHGRPMRVEARRSLLIERDSKKHNPKDHAKIIRQYPLSIAEIFWVSAEQCVFNATVLQNRKMKLDSMTIPPYSKYDLKWEKNVRFSKIIFSHNENGWYKSSWMFPGDAFQKLANNVRRNPDGTFSPLNESVFTSGVDPVDHQVVIQNVIGSGEDEYVSTRRSKPVMHVKRRYDAGIDGELTQEILEQRRDEEYPYKTGIYIGLMDMRPSDPNVYFERALMICWLHGMSLNAESSKPGIINYFILNNCRDFIKAKYIPEAVNKHGYQGEGTPANSTMINEYTDCIATWIEYFGHTDPFIESVNDHLVFNPAKTKEHDYTVGKGWCEIGERVRPKTVTLPQLNIEDILPTFRNGERVWHRN